MMRDNIGCHSQCIYGVQLTSGLEFI